MKIFILALSIAWLVITVSPCSADGRKAKNHKVRITGSVVARKFSAANLAIVTDSPTQEILIVRITQKRKKPSLPIYLKMLVKRSPTDPLLPKEVYDSKQEWVFALERENKCDATIEYLDSTLAEVKLGTAKPLQQLVPTLGAEKEKLPKNVILSCYILDLEVKNAVTSK